MYNRALTDCPTEIIRGVTHFCLPPEGQHVLILVLVVVLVVLVVVGIITSS